MAPDPLATTTDLSTLGVDTSDAALTALALDAASAAVREAAGSTISQATSTFTTGGTTSTWLPLPTVPAGAVSSVLLDGSPVTDHKVIDGTLWRAAGWQRRCGEPSEVEVTLTHGYAVVPADIILLVCELAAAGINAAVEGVEVKTRVQSEGIDDYNVSYVTGAEALASVMELPERTRIRLAQRFGGGVHVVGSRS